MPVPIAAFYVCLAIRDKLFSFRELNGNPYLPMLDIEKQNKRRTGIQNPKNHVHICYFIPKLNDNRLPFGSLLCYFFETPVLKDEVATPMDGLQ